MKQLRFDLVMCSAIVLLALGGLGGSLQPARLLLIAGLPFALPAMLQIRRWTQVQFLTLATYALLAGLGALSLVWSPAKADGLSRMLVVMIGLSSILYVCLTPMTVEAARRVRDAWSVALALTLPFAMYELTTGDHFAYALDERNFGGSIGALPFASVFFGNFNDYCTFIALSLPMLLGTMESAPRRIARWAWATCALLAVVVIVVNTNRISMFFVSWLILYFTVTRKAWRRAVLVLAFLVVALAATEVLNDAIDSIVFITDLRFEGLGSDESAEQRSGLIAAGIESLVSTYGMGIGVGGIEHYLVSNYPNLIPNLHNLLVEIAANFGLVPAIAFCTWLVYMFVSLRSGQLPRDLKSPVIATLPFVPLIGAIGSQAIGYTYWWLWFSTVMLLAATGQTLRLRCAPPAAGLMPRDAAVGIRP